MTNAQGARPLRISAAVLSGADPEQLAQARVEKTPEAVAEEEQSIEAEMDRLGGLLAEHEEVERAMLEKQHDYEAIMKHTQRPELGGALSPRPTRPTSPRAAVRSPQVARRTLRARNDSGSSDQSGAVPLSPRAAAVAADAPLSSVTGSKLKPLQETPLSPAAPLKGQGPQLSSPLIEKLQANWGMVWLLVMQRRAEIQGAIEELVQVQYHTHTSLTYTWTVLIRVKSTSMLYAHYM